uniref:Receptor-like serine/threonine-protein kinase n=1 Tax=Wollemia nobilis TaxID=56998 RepID=A0A0C9S462_9CONI
MESATKAYSSYFKLCIWLTCALLYISSASARQSSGLEKLRSGFSPSTQGNQTVLMISQDGTYSVGFYSVGENAVGFAIWYSDMVDTVVWMANRDQPVNGRNSRLRLQKDGDLVLSDAGGTVVWRTNTKGHRVREVKLPNTGNLVLLGSSADILWQSFDSPTDTLLPEQPFTKDTQLLSRADLGTYKSGYYRFYFNEDNYLGLIYTSPNLSSKYWPHPWLNAFDNGRTTYNITRLATLHRSGIFNSSDQFTFIASDHGESHLRRLTMDFDGNLRLYSLDKQNRSWRITWIALPEQCRVHGYCGPNGLCVYTPKPKCMCLPGFEMVDPTDWFQGCRLIKELSCGPKSTKLLRLPYTDYYGFDKTGYGVSSFEECEKICMDDCYCLGFSYRLSGTGQCFPKSLLMSGYQSPGGPNHMYVKISINDSSVKNVSSVAEQVGWKPLQCSTEPQVPANISSALARKAKKSQLIIPLSTFVSAIGAMEIVFIALGWYFMFKNYDDDILYNRQGYFAVPTGLKKFTFSELKRATNNFRDIVGKGGFGTVYKGLLLPDNKMVAVKRLEGVSHGEEEFWAEVSMIGRVHHINLVRMLGFCAERKNRLLVYEYVENGSLDNYLFAHDSTRFLEWKKRLQIAVGTAKGLGYLHEDCLEWILHCDIKPQNILLDKQFCPKVSDFGMAKLVDSHRDRALTFSTIRGTRGYMAPEWTMNLPITAKADVYSFGILLLELVSGRDAAKFNIAESGGNFVQWAFENVRRGNWKENLVDSKLAGEGRSKVEAEIERMLKTALVCVEQDKDKRPSMGEVVEMLMVSLDREEEEKKERDRETQLSTGIKTGMVEMARVFRHVGMTSPYESSSSSGIT